MDVMNTKREKNEMYRCVCVCVCVIVESGVTDCELGYVDGIGELIFLFSDLPVYYQY